MGEWGKISLFYFTYVVLKIRENDAEVQWKYLSYHNESIPIILYDQNVSMTKGSKNMASY